MINACKTEKIFYGFLWKREENYEYSRRTVAYDPFTNVYFYFRGVYECARLMVRNDDVSE